MKRALWLLLICVVSAASPISAAEELHILSGGRVTPPSIVERFEKEHGIRVRIENFETYETMAAYMEASRRDMALLREHYVEHLWRNNWIAPINHDLIPNIKNLWPHLLDIGIDPDNTHCVPYLHGTLGILYRGDIFGDARPDWSSVLDKGSVTAPFAVTDQYRDALGLALTSLGYSYNSNSPITIGQAAEALRDLNAHPSFMGFLDVETTTRFFKEKFIYLAATYSNVAALVMVHDPTLVYVMPERRITWTYVYVINKDSPNIEAAHKWLNYLMEPEVAAEVSAWNKAASPNRAAWPLLPAEIRDNRLIYPPASVWANALAPSGVGEEAERLILEYWTGIK